MNTSFAKRSNRWTPLGIAAMVLGFIVWWPLGLAVIAYIMWGGSVDDLAADLVSQFKSAIRPRASGSGNAAFDAYREETLRRLEEEQREFTEFVTRLRHARDREEFERFMAERNQAKEPAKAKKKS